jgi:hypothetical protein
MTSSLHAIWPLPTFRHPHPALRRLRLLLPLLHHLTLHSLPLAPAPFTSQDTRARPRTPTDHPPPKARLHIGCFKSFCEYSFTNYFKVGHGLCHSRCLQSTSRRGPFTPQEQEAISRICGFLRPSLWSIHDVVSPPHSIFASFSPQLRAGPKPKDM